jgi:hypothetical protein
MGLWDMLDKEVRERIRNYINEHQRFKQIALLLFIVAIIGLAIISNAQKDNTAQVAQSTQQINVKEQALAQSNVLQETSIKVVATQLQKDYEENPFTADKKYKDNLLDVYGKILFIDKNSNGVPCIAFVANTSMDIVLFTLPNDEDPYLVQIKPGIFVTIQGKCLGEQDATLGKNIAIDKCKIISVLDNSNTAKQKESLLYQYYNK